VQIGTDSVGSRATNFPLALSQITMFPDAATAQYWALLGQDPSLCGIFFNGQTNEQNSINNCGKLNRAPNRFPPVPRIGATDPMPSNDPGLLFLSSGTYHYVSTRNNNFSNRSQKASIFVSGVGLTPGQVAGIVIGSLAAVGLVAGGVLFYGKRHRDSAPGRCYTACADGATRCRNKCTPGSGSTSSGQTSTSPATTASVPSKTVDMEYRRY